MSTSEPLIADELAAMDRMPEEWARLVRRLLATVRAEQRRADDAEAGRDHLKRREADIIAATEPADGGQWRADIVSAIKRLRRERDEAMAEAERLRGELLHADGRGDVGRPVGLPVGGAAVGGGGGESEQRSDGDELEHGGLLGGAGEPAALG